MKNENEEKTVNICQYLKDYANERANERIKEWKETVVKNMLQHRIGSVHEIAELCDVTVERVQEIRAAMLQEIVDDFIDRVDPYMDLEPLRFDLRGYAAYLKEHNLDGRDVPEEVIERFKIK